MGSGLTPCFVDGPVMLTPVAILAVCGPWQIYSLFRTQTSGAPTRKNWTFWTKAALLAFQIIHFLLLLSNQHFNGWNGSLPFLSPFLTLASIILVAVPLHYLEYYRSRIPCGSLLFFWLLSPIGLLLKTYNVYTRVGFGTTAQIYLASTITALAMFIVEWAILSRFRLRWLWPDKCDNRLSKTPTSSPDSLSNGWDLLCDRVTTTT